MPLTHIEPENRSKPKRKGSSLPNINFQVRSFREGMLNPDSLSYTKWMVGRRLPFLFGKRSLFRGELLNFGGVNLRVSYGFIMFHKGCSSGCTSQRGTPASEAA